jgi:hypothetical protein
VCLLPCLHMYHSDVSSYMCSLSKDVNLLQSIDTFDVSLIAYTEYEVYIKNELDHTHSF